MKSLKTQKNIKSMPFEDSEKLKGKKKMSPNSSKVNIKSNKFWKDVYNEEGDEIEKYRSL